MLTKQFGRRLKYWREKRGLSLTDLCLLTGIDRTGIAHYERGDRNPTLYTVEKFLSVLNVSITEFFEEDNYGNEQSARIS